MGKPILPRNDADPVGADRSERRAMADFQRRMRQVLQVYRDALHATPYRTVTVNATRYEFDLNPAILASLTAEIDRAVDRILLEGGADQLWFTVVYVVPSYQAGTAAQWRNLGAQSERYKLGRLELASILQSQPYRERIAYLAARQFENMQGLTATTKVEMGRILTDGFVQGLNPREIGKQLTAQAGIEARRGDRIARTEIGNALRQARLDEAQQAGTDFGLHTREMHFSALSPTTRASHAARHGRTYTAQEQRVWWASDANSINCYLPGTRVAGRFVAGSKARYQGPAVKLVTADGANLSVTANHPVLTATGLRAAADIREGDYLLAYSSQVKNSVGVVELDDKQMQPTVEQVFGALVQIAHSLRSGVHAIDFHGDGAFMQEDIDVVRSDWELTCALDAGLGQSLDCLQLEHADSVFRSPDRPFRLDFLTVDLAAPRRVSRCRKGGPLGRRGISGAGECTLGSITERQTSPGKPAIDDRAGHPELLGQGQHGNAGHVKPVQVVRVETFDFSGHVYDLEELSGLMVANGIIASNCKCSTITVLTNAQGVPLDPALISRVRAMRKDPGPA